jgi:hypothetical protein
MTRKVAENRVKARFFCEACGAEVKAGAVSCPSCGRMFAAVRCPECGFAGKAEDFRAGCPVCGKGAPRPAASVSPAASPQRRVGRAFTARRPSWLYPVITMALAALVVALLALLFLS